MPKPKANGKTMEWQMTETETYTTHCAIALRVMAKTNASKLRSEMMTVEIAARMAGVDILE